MSKLEMWISEWIQSEKVWSFTGMKSGCGNWDEPVN